MNTATQNAADVRSQSAPEAGAGSQAPALTQPRPRVERAVVDSPVPIFDTRMFDHMMRIAKLMATSSLVPEHLNSIKKVGGRDYAIEPDEAVANCFLVVNQAMHWKMDPFAVAQHTHVNKGKIGYEGKLIAAAINSNPSILERLSYKYEGTGTSRKVTVTARHVADKEAKSIDGTVGQWQTAERDGTVKENWRKNPDQQLSYRGAREWARRHFPEIILGVWGDDELDFETAGSQPSTDQPAPPQRGAAGLRAALVGGAEAATDATVIESASTDTSTDDKQPNEPGQPEDKKKPDGTLEKRNEIMAKFAQCKDMEILALAADEARDFEWTRADQEVINASYNKRRGELERS